MTWILVQLTIAIMMLGDDEDDCCATVTSMMSMILIQLTIARMLPMLMLMIIEMMRCASIVTMIYDLGSTDHSQDDDFVDVDDDEVDVMSMILV